MNKSADSQVVNSCNIYQFNITLHHITPRTWRRIQVPGYYNFRDLHYAIQDAMGWKDCHLHQFEMINPKTGHKDLITAPDPDYDFPFVLEEKAKIAEYFLSPKDKAIYEYDPFDSWTHDIVLEQILPAVTYPQCLAGEGACPKEDDDQSCSSSTDQFDPKSVIFKKRECQDDVRLKSMSKATEACPSTDCGGVDRGNNFNPKSISLSKGVDSNTVSKATEVRLIKRACPPTDCGGVDRGNNFNPKSISLSKGVDSNTVSKATEVRLIKRTCPPTDCGGVDRGNTFNPKSISLSKGVDSNTVSKATEVRLIKRACPPTDCGGVDRGNNFNPKLIKLSNNADLNNMNKATETSQNNRACPPENRGGVARGNDIDPRLISLGNSANSNSIKRTEKPVQKSCNVYQLKIILQRFKPPIWRRVQVPGESTFKDLHYVIQKVMGWSNSHLHQFRMKNYKTRREECYRVLLDPDYDYGEIRNERETKIAAKFLAPKDKAIYLYDLGFSWTHDIVLEKILPAVASITYPRCLAVAGRRKTPKEDPTESEQEDEELFYNPDEDKFDPKSVKFS